MSSKKPFVDILIDEKLFTQKELYPFITKQMDRNSSLSSILVSEGYMSSSDIRRIITKNKSKMYIGDLLLETGLIKSRKQLDEAMALQEQSGIKLGKALVKLGYITSDDLFEGLCQQTDIMKIIPETELAQDIRPSLQQPFMEDNMVLPYRLDEGVLTVLMSDPFNEPVIERLHKFYGTYKLEVAYTPPDDLLRFFNKKKAWEHYQQDSKSGKTNARADHVQMKLNVELSSDKSSSEGMKIFSLYLRKAIEMKASDMHIEPQDGLLRIRFAVDGMLMTITNLPYTLAAPIAGIIKIACGLDITKKSIPGDGRISVTLQNKHYDLRVSTYPAIYGENIVIRILQPDQALGSLEMLGMSPANLRKLKSNLDVPFGIAIVTGPTGSGKTTTLYTILGQVAKKDKHHIITVEDPVEYRLSGITQANTNEKLGFDYTAALTSIMRQNPDIILVGEIRDKKAAYAVIQAAMTGHKVFTTFHTESSTGALARLMDMGVENFLISETVVFVIAQRLVRKMCPECQEEYKPLKSVLRAFFAPEDMEKVMGLKFMRGTGKINGARCENCNGTGYKGRIGVHEVLEVTEGISDAILNNQRGGEIRRIAKHETSFLSLKEDAVYKIIRGWTTFEDCLRVIPMFDEKTRRLDDIIRLSEDKGVEVEEVIQRGRAEKSAPVVVPKSTDHQVAQLVKWDDKYSVGLATIDLHHKILFDIINDLYHELESTNKTSVILKTFEQLCGYVVFHFTEEELYMEAINLPGLDKHREQHKLFIKTVGEYRAKYDTGAEINIRDIIMFLGTWIKNHILKEDRRILLYTRAKSEEETHMKKVPETLSERIPEKIPA